MICSSVNRLRFMAPPILEELTFQVDQFLGGRSPSAMTLKPADKVSPLQEPFNGSGPGPSVIISAAMRGISLRSKRP
jgi:hypothetical protein